MFKNRSKLTKKLVMFVAMSAIPLGIVVASGHASAMFKLSQFRGLSAQTASTNRKIVVPSRPREIGYGELTTFSDDELMSFRQDILTKRIPLNVSIELVVCRCKFKFAKFLIENNLSDCNHNVFNRKDWSPLAQAIARLTKEDNYNLSENVLFIEYLLGRNDITLYGTPCCARPLIYAFKGAATLGGLKEPTSEVCSAVITVFESLIKRGMDVNALDYNGETLRYALENMSREYRSPYYDLIHQLVCKHGGRLYV